MKKRLSLLIALCFLLALAGCGGESVELKGSGTPADPYLISNAAQLEQMSRLINGEQTRKTYDEAHYRLTADIDLGGKDWEPIGSYEAPFYGVLEGDGHTISGLNVSSANDTKLGFIAVLHKGAVQNLTISNSTFSGSSSKGAEVAAVVGYCSSGTITNCHTTDSVKVFGTYHAAGICGSYNSHNPMAGCSNAGEITLEERISGTAAGIVADCNAPLVDCTNSGTVHSSSDAAGIAGNASGGLSGCVNSGSVTARDGAAGIVCSFGDGALNPSQNNAEVTMENCVNSGTITALEDIAGGIAVSCRTGIVKNCVNSGAVSGPNGAGGILAYFQPSAFGTPAPRFTVSGCENSGSICITTNTGNSPAGGICGEILGGNETEFLFENCANSGEVITTGQENVLDNSGPAGSIIGVCRVKTIELLSCTNSGKITGTWMAGGMVGLAQPIDTNNLPGTLFRASGCVNSGDVYVVNSGGLTTELYVGGMVGTLGYYNQKQWFIFETVEYIDCTNTGSLSGDTDGPPLRIHEQCGSVLSDLK